MAMATVAYRAKTAKPAQGESVVLSFVVVLKMACPVM